MTRTPTRASSRPIRLWTRGWRAFGYVAFLVLLGIGGPRLRADHLYYDEEPFGPQEFTLSNRAWNPGSNSARTGGNPAPGAATFSIMGAGFRDASGRDGRHVNTLFDHASVDITTLLAGTSDTFDFYKNMINDALNVWDAPSGFTNLGFVADGNVDAGASQASGGHLGDIRVAAWEITTGPVLAHAFFPTTQAHSGFGGTIGGDVHIDVNRTWMDNPNAVALQLDLFTVLLHELGHSLGLGHSADPTAVMNATYFGARRTLTADDIAGIQAIYGVPEPGTFVMLLIGAASVAVSSRRRRSLSR